jgi:hypothetical protein
VFRTLAAKSLQLRLMPPPAPKALYPPLQYAALRLSLCVRAVQQRRVLQSLALLLWRRGADVLRWRAVAAAFAVPREDLRYHFSNRGSGTRSRTSDASGTHESPPQTLSTMSPPVDATPRWRGRSPPADPARLSASSLRVSSVHGSSHGGGAAAVGDSGEHSGRRSRSSNRNGDVEGDDIDAEGEYYDDGDDGLGGDVDDDVDIEVHDGNGSGGLVTGNGRGRVRRVSEHAASGGSAGGGGGGGGGGGDGNGNGNGNGWSYTPPPDTGVDGGGSASPFADAAAASGGRSAGLMKAMIESMQTEQQQGSHSPAHAQRSREDAARQQRLQLEQRRRHKRQQQEHMQQRRLARLAQVPWQSSLKSAAPAAVKPAATRRPLRSSSASPPPATATSQRRRAAVPAGTSVPSPGVGSDSDRVPSMIPRLLGRTARVSSPSAAAAGTRHRVVSLSPPPSHAHSHANAFSDSEGVVKHVYDGGLIGVRPRVSRRCVLRGCIGG